MSLSSLPIELLERIILLSKVTFTFQSTDSGSGPSIVSLQVVPSSDHRHGHHRAAAARPSPSLSRQSSAYHLPPISTPGVLAIEPLGPIAAVSGGLLTRTGSLDDLHTTNTGEVQSRVGGAGYNPYFAFPSSSTTQLAGSNVDRSYGDDDHSESQRPLLAPTPFSLHAAQRSPSFVIPPINSSNESILVPSRVGTPLQLPESTAYGTGERQMYQSSITHQSQEDIEMLADQDNGFSANNPILNNGSKTESTLSILSRINRSLRATLWPLLSRVLVLTEARARDMLNRYGIEEDDLVDDLNGTISDSDEKEERNLGPQGITHKANVQRFKTTWVQHVATLKVHVVSPFPDPYVLYHTSLLLAFLASSLTSLKFSFSPHAALGHNISNLASRGRDVQSRRASQNHRQNEPDPGNRGVFLPFLTLLDTHAFQRLKLVTIFEPVNSDPLDLATGSQATSLKSTRSSVLNLDDLLLRAPNLEKLQFKGKANVDAVAAMKLVTALRRPRHPVAPFFGELTHLEMEITGTQLNQGFALKEAIFATLGDFGGRLTLWDRDKKANGNSLNKSKGLRVVKIRSDYSATLFKAAEWVKHHLCALVVRNSLLEQLEMPVLPCLFEHFRKDDPPNHEKMQYFARQVTDLLVKGSLDSGGIWSEPSLASISSLKDVVRSAVNRRNIELGRIPKDDRCELGPIRPLQNLSVITFWIETMIVTKLVRLPISGEALGEDTESMEVGLPRRIPRIWNAFQDGAGSSILVDTEQSQFWQAQVLRRWDERSQAWAVSEVKSEMIEIIR